MKNCGRTGFVLFLAVALSFITASKAGAQQSSNQSNYRLRIDSNPRGAYVEISGRYTFVGRTPFVIPYKLVGNYKIVASKEGYETVNASVTLATKGANQISFRLSKKTRAKAAFRSTVLPGWGQLYGQSKLKGIGLAVAQAGLLTTTLIVHNKYRNEKREFDAAQAQYLLAAASSLDQAMKADIIRQKEFREADKAYDVRNVMLVVSAGFWVYNLLDSMILFNKGSRPARRGVRLTPYFTGERDNKKLMMSLNVNL